jgi:Xaa-Pro dipeptidase
LEPECYGAIRVSDGRSILFVPRLPDEYAVWMGKIPSLDNYKSRYEVDEVHYVDQVGDYFVTCKVKEL